MPPDDVPADIRDLADRRATARRTRDWRTADALRDELLAAGWKVIDSGTLYDLERAAPPDVAEGEQVRYGSSSSVPSRLDDAPVGVASVVLVATGWPEDLAGAIRSLVEHSPDGTQLVVVANDPSDDQAAALEGLDAADPGAPGISTEVVRTSAPLGWAAALNAGIRRAAAPVVILMDTSVEPEGDLVSALVAALDDPTVAVAGPFGVVSEDLRRFQEADEGVTEVDAIEGYALAFRRQDYAERGPLDEHFAFYRNLDIWWSLVLRDQPEDAGDDAAEDAADGAGDGGEHGGDDSSADVAPRRAVRVTAVPVTRHEHRGWTTLNDAERDRLAKKNFYRILKRFATRRDLLVSASADHRS